MQKIILALLAGRNHDGDIRRSKGFEAGLVEGYGHKEHRGHFIRLIVCVDSAVEHKKK